MTDAELIRRIAGGLSDIALAKGLGVDDNLIQRVRTGQYPINGKLYLALLRQYPLFTKDILACLTRPEEVSG